MFHSLLEFKHLSIHYGHLIYFIFFSACEQLPSLQMGIMHTQRGEARPPTYFQDQPGYILMALQMTSCPSYAASILKQFGLNRSSWSLNSGGFLFGFWFWFRFVLFFIYTVFFDSWGKSNIKGICWGGRITQLFHTSG